MKGPLTPWSQLATNIAVGGLLAAATVSTAHAQAAPASPAKSEGLIEEVIVTARRQAENVQEIPVVVTAISAEGLRDAQVTTARELVTLVPSLTVSTGNAREGNRFTIRGQGVTAGAGPGVSVYFAEAPVPQFGAGGPGLYYDLQSVQVLNGPQGTLFGRNTTGGAVLFTPEKPNNENSGWIQAGYGNYANREVTGMVNWAVAPDLFTVRFAGEMRARNGFTHNLYDGVDYDNLNYVSLRAGALFTPSDNFSNYTLITYQKSTPNGTAFMLVDVNPATTGITASPAPTRPLIPQLQALLQAQRTRGYRTSNFNAPGFWYAKALGITNTATYEVNGALTFKDIFSYYDTKIQNGFDLDGTPFNINGFVRTPTSGNTSGNGQALTEYFTNEAQASGKLFDGQLTYVGGFYWEKYQPTGFESNTSDRLIASGAVSRTRFEAHEWSTSKAIFGQASLSLGVISPALERLKITGGYRRTWDSKHEVYASFVETPVASCTFAGPVYPNCFADKRAKFEAGTYTLALDYKVSDRVLVYATNRTGYKSGGFNTTANPASTDVSFSPEHVDDVEIGVKSDFNISGVPTRLNLAAYRDKYTDVQRFIATGLGSYIRNAAAATIKGVEVEGTFLPIEGLELKLNYAYLDAKFDSYIYKTGGFSPVDYSGEPLTNSPKHKVGFVVTYVLPIDPSLGPVRLTASYTYQSKYKTQDENLPTNPPGQPGAYMPGSVLGGYGLLNLGMTWKNIKGSPIDMEVFVTNVGNKTYAYATQAYWYAYGVSAQSFGEPRMYGMRLRYNFGG